MTWSDLDRDPGPEMWSFWRVKDDANGVHYTAAYEDGDKSVALFSSTDGGDLDDGRRHLRRQRGHPAPRPS